MDRTEDIQFRKSARCWVVLVGCCISAAVGFTICATCWSVFVTPLVTEEGLNYTQASSYITIMTLASIVVMLLGDKLLKFGAGKVTVIAGCLIGAGFIALASAPSMATIALAAILNGFSYPMLSLYAAPVIIKNWFHKNEGTFVGIALACIGIGGVIFSPLTTSLIATYGWRSAMITLAIISIVVQAIVGIFMIRTSPIPMGILPYGEDEESLQKTLAGGGQKENPAMLPGLKLSAAFKNASGWLMMLVFVCLAAMATVTTNLNPAVQTFGYTAASAGIVLSFSSVGNITGKLVMGFVHDKKGAAIATTVAAAMAVIGFVGYVLCFKVTFSVPLLCASAFICGNGCCMATMMPPLLVMDAFGKKDYDRVYGVFSAARGLFQAIIVIVIGRMVDMSGTYMSTVILWIALALVIVPLAFAAIKAGKAKWNASK